MEVILPLVQDEISPRVTGWQVYREWGELLLGNKVKYCMYQYEICDSKVRAVSMPLNKLKVSIDEYPESEAI